MGTAREPLPIGTQHAASRTSGPGHPFASPSPSPSHQPSARSPCPPAAVHVGPAASAHALTELLGRAAELRFVTGLLGPRGTRLVSLAGPGGIGKIRLAIGAAQAAKASFADGVGWISLAAVSQQSQAVPTISRALGLADGQHRSLFEAVLAALRDAHLLLILDNFEQVVEASGEVAHRLHGCPRLSILVTGRSRLRVRGEHVVLVPPLGLEATEDGISDVVMQFVDRAAESDPSAAFDVSGLQVAADICRRVDGLPLAIEPAAARVGHMSLNELRARMEHRLEVLTGGTCDLPERHQTLRATIARSYDLLTPEERDVLRRMAVFSDGFSLEAAETVAMEPATTSCRTKRPFPAHGVADLIDSLVDKSLVRYERDGADGGRYWLLETSREFAAEKLAASPDEVSARAAHARWIAGFAARAAPFPLMPTRPDDLEMLDIELSNVRVALEWWESDGDSAGFTQLVSALNWYWWSRGLWDEGMPWLMAAWGRASRATGLPDIASLAHWHGITLVAYAGDLDEAEHVVRAGLANAQSTGNTMVEAAVQIDLGWIANLRGDDRIEVDAREPRSPPDVTSTTRSTGAWP